MNIWTNCNQAQSGAIQIPLPPPKQAEKYDNRQKMMANITISSEFLFINENYERHTVSAIFQPSDYQSTFNKTFLRFCVDEENGQRHDENGRFFPEMLSPIYYF